MSMSTKITGVRDLDKEFKKMMKVKLACEEAEIDYPENIYKYFINPDESEESLREKMEFVSIKEAICVKNKDMIDGWQVDLSKLPKDVKAIRFENSY